MTVPVIVGAYAAVPADRPGQEAFYAHLPSWVTGIEIPYRAALDADPAWLAAQLRGRFDQSVVTAIPATMGRLAADPHVGLASPDAAGRAAALAFVREILAAVDALHADAGARLVRRLQVHSAPTDHADRDAFARSLDALLPEVADAGLELVVEHCDAGSGAGPGEKRFLDLADELAAVADTPIRITVNWGRSVVETHDPDTPRRHVAALVAAGRLGGLMFSGAGPDATVYGPAWADAHLPLAPDEPTSWLTAARVAACVAAASGRETYRGIKIQAPATASVAQRIAMIERVHAAMETPASESPHSDSRHTA